MNPSEDNQDLVPFATFRGHLKSVRLGNLDQIQKKAAELAFSEFFAEPERNDAALKEISDLVNSLIAAGRYRGLEAPFGYRRFAGSASLPRACYFSVCADGGGNDTQTLARELMAYIRPQVSGEVYAIDLDDPDVDDARSYYRGFLGEGIEPTGKIALSFRSRPGAVTPFFKTCLGMDLFSANSDTPVFLPTQVDEVEISKTIDLRLPSVQTWLFASLSSGIPRLAYSYGKRIQKGLELRPDITSHAIGDSDLQLDGGSRTARIYPPLTDRSGEIAPVPQNFFGLLPALMFSGRGGSPLTDGIGQWLQEIGANALVFPSARADCGFRFENGALIDWPGWNLVDFREADAPDSDVRLIMEPVSWIEWAGKELTISPEDSEERGSWRVKGNVESHMKWLNAEFEHYYKIQGSS